MIVPTKLIESRYAEASASAFMDRDKFRWFNISPGLNHLSRVYDNDFDVIDRCSVTLPTPTADLVIHGHFSASVDREVNSIGNLSAFVLTPGSRTFVRDFRTFIEGLVASYEVVRFNVVIGNPAEKTWARGARRLGGGPIGVFSQYGRLEDGRHYDVRWYEIKGRGGR